MKRILSLIIAVSVILSVTAVIPVSAGTEELEVYLYEDFVSGYKEGEEDVKSFAGLKRSLINGEYVYALHKNITTNHQTVNFGKELVIPEGNKVVLEYKVSGNYVSGSDQLGFSANSIPTLYFTRDGIKAEGYTDKVVLSRPDINAGITVTLVYDNENPARDIFIDGRYVGTFDTSSSEKGKTFCKDGTFTLEFFNRIHLESQFNYHYIKIYQAPSDYNAETFFPAMYNNVGKISVKSAGITVYDKNFYYNVINNLGFYFEYYEGETYKPDEPMTRMQFAGILANILNVLPVANPQRIYNDVPSRNYMAGTLEALNQMGLMRGTSDVTFSPDDAVTAPMAAAALIRALGYKELAEYYSGYETGYMEMANKAGLFKGVSDLSNLTGKDVIRILYNFINCEVYETVGISNGNYIKDAVEGNTVLKVYHNIGGIRDILKTNDVTSLTSKKGTDKGSVVIGNLKFDTNGISMNKYLGYNIEAYYDVDTEKILFAGITEKNKTLIIDSDNFINYLNHKITYEENTKELVASLSSATDIIYNNKSEAFSKDLFNGITNGNITLVDNNGDNKYDVCFINTYINGVLDTKSTDGNILRFKNNVNNIKLDDYDSYDIYNHTGETFSFGNLKENNILSICESKDKSYIAITVSTGSHIGTLKSVYTDESTTWLDIDGTLVKADSLFINNTAFIKPGITGEFFADAYGKIAYYMEVVTRNSGYAYFLNIVDKGEHYDEMYIKMYTESNQILSIPVRKKITIDGVSGQPRESLMSYKQLYNLDSQGEIESVKPQLISYTLTEDGMLSKIDTLKYNEGAEDPDSTILPLISISEQGYNSINKSFGKDLYLNEGCMVFSVPESGASSAPLEDFSVGYARNLFVSEMRYTLSAFKTSNDTYGADIIVANLKGGSGFDNSDHAYIISDITDIWDSSEEAAVKKVSYFHDGKESYCISKNPSYLTGVEKGDIVILNINIENELVDAPKMRYDLDADTDNDDSTVQIPEIGWGGIHRTYYGAVYGIKGSLIAITKDPTAQNVVTELHRVPTYIYTVDTKLSKVLVGEINDITDYLSDKVNYSKVVFYETRGYDYDLVILK